MEGSNRKEPFNKQAVDNYGEIGGINSFCSDYGFCGNQSSPVGSTFLECQNQEQHVDSFVDGRLFDDLRFDMLFPPLQAAPVQLPDFDEKESGMLEVSESNEKNLHPYPLASLELLKEYGKGFKRLKSERDGQPGNDTTCTKPARPELSTVDIMRMAGARFIHSSTAETTSILISPCDLSLSYLSEEEVKSVQLAELLLASAEKVGKKQYERASRLLSQCDSLSSSTGNAVQRVTYYFSKALQERIDRETGKITEKGSNKGRQIDVDEALMIPNPSIPACHGRIPFYQVAHMVSVQAIVENVAKAKKIHVIDLKIRNGIHLSILMRALASRSGRPVEHLKVSAVGTASKQLIEETGKRLTSFAQAEKFPFTFKIVMVPNLIDIKEDLFELDADEAVAVYSEYCLRTLIVHPNQVDCLMKVIKNMNPCIMVVTEVEANHTAPAFVSRFIEALFYKSAYFDCINACMERNDPSRTVMESFYLGERIRNLVAIEGEERDTRNVKMDVWRTYFSQFGMVETELSASSMYQAELVLKKFPCWKSCTFNRDGRSLIIGWKGTPLLSLSTWKFFTKRIKRL